jgi:hypothetical protein
MRSATFLLAAIAFLSALLIQSGELGTSDTNHRLQTAHSFWTGEPAVFPGEYPEFGLIGRGGRLYSWYGMGQSLLMLPADVVGTFLARLPIFDAYDGTDPGIREIFVSLATNSILAVLTMLVCLQMLLRLDFSPRQAAAGALAFFFATTHLHYTQNMTENNLIALMTLTGFCFQFRWLRTGSRWSLLLGCAALGLNLLTRLTTALDLVACAGFLLLVCWLEGDSAVVLMRRGLAYAKTALWVYAVFLLVDRLYQYHRFGSFLNTYMTVFGQQYRRADPTLPAAFPFDGRFADGFLGPLFSPEKSIFLFDPLLLLSLIAAVCLWKRLTATVKAFFIASWLLLLGYICFYARYRWWGGDFAWGDRYISTAVQLAALLALPSILRFGAGRWLRITAWGLISVSAAIQAASLCFWLPLEIYQMETLGHPTFVIALRFKNIAAFVLGKMDAWGLTNQAMRQDSWDYVHLTTWNILPFLLRRVGAAPSWVVSSLMAAWAIGLAGVAWLGYQLFIKMKTAD